MKNFLVCSVSNGILSIKIYITSALFTLSSSEVILTSEGANDANVHWTTPIKINWFEIIIWLRNVPSWFHISISKNHACKWYNLDVKISKEPYTSFMQMLRIYKTISKDMWTIFNKNHSKCTLMQLSTSPSVSALFSI